MKTSTAIIAIFLAGCLFATGCVHHHHSQPVVETTATAGGPVGSDPVVDMFYNDLAPYGEWLYVDGPGWVWAPYDVEADWRPYQYGHWVYTDYGWTWASDEEYGWAVYHYGRWHNAPRYGWVWVPGSEWGPAWVAWHGNDDWIGWAPLPYHVRWRAGVGLDWGSSSIHVSIQSGYWSFVATRYLVEPHVHRHVAPRTRNTTYINVTKNVTNYTYIDNRVVNRSVHVKKVGKAIGHPVHKHHVRHSDNPGRTRGGQGNGDDLVIYRPREHPGREPQRRPIPPGHADEHRGKKDGHGKKNDQGRNDREERPAADRSHRGGKSDTSNASESSTRPRRNGWDDGRSQTTAPDRERNSKSAPEQGRSDGRNDRVKPNQGYSGRTPHEREQDSNGRTTRPTSSEEHNPKSKAPRDHSSAGGKREHPHTSQPDRSQGGDSGNDMQAAPRSTREPQPATRPGASDYKRWGSKSDKSSGAKSKSETNKSGKSKDADAKDGKSKNKDAKDDKSNNKDGKSEEDDPEEEEQDSGKKGSKKRG